MESPESKVNTTIRFEANEQPPVPITAGLGMQFVILTIAGIVLTPAIVVRAAEGTAGYLTWGVFAAVVVSGITTILQAVRVGRIGAGYVLMMGTSAAFISVCIAAIVEGGPSMLATLVAISALFQFGLAGQLHLFRRILTPSVAGTVIMLIPVTIMPVIFDMLDDVPVGSPGSGAPVTALVTFGVMVIIGLRARGALRLWAPVIGVIVGSVVAVGYGIFDFSTVREAAWVGIPSGGWPGFDLSFNATFWSLLPGFIFVTLVGAIETIGDSVAIQGVSWRKHRAVDYRAVQGALSADGLGNLLSGLMGTMPNTTYSTSVSVTELTGVASRSVGVAIGIFFVSFAFLPKLLALIVAIPGPIAAAYLTVLLAMLFVVGMRIIIRSGIDYRKGLIVGVAFWVGVGLQANVVFPGFFSEFAGGLLHNGMTAGGLVAIILTLFVELTQPKSHRIVVPLNEQTYTQLTPFMEKFTMKSRWDEGMATRINGAVEEVIVTLQGRQAEGEEGRSLQLIARKREGKAVLEFISGFGKDNLQDMIALIGEPDTMSDIEEAVSLRLLSHYASSVRHQQYHDADVIIVNVDPT